jgi:beta-lactamase class D
MSAKFTTIVYLFSLLAAACAEPAGQGDTDARMKSILGAYEGCVIVKEVGGKTILRYNDKRCAEPFSPCSTFKIFNAIAGLDSGVVTGPDMLLKWDGSKQYMKAWEHDHTLASAIKESVVWYFREVAKRIGQERMQKYLTENNYGNKDMSGGLEKFWIESTLKISANEQIEFLETLYTGQLKFSPKAVETVKKLIVQKEGGGTVFSGKTGSGRRDEQDEKALGWFVGHVRKNDRQYVFAVNITGKGAYGKEARKIAEEVLADEGLLPEP